MVIFHCYVSSPEGSRQSLSSLFDLLRAIVGAKSLRIWDSNRGIKTLDAPSDEPHWSTRSLRSQRVSVIKSCRQLLCDECSYLWMLPLSIWVCPKMVDNVAYSKTATRAWKMMVSNWINWNNWDLPFSNTPRGQHCALALVRMPDE